MADAIFAVGSLFFIVALFPMLRAETKPPPLSASITGFWLWAFAFTYASLDLTYAAVTTAVSAAMWTSLAIQSLRRNQLTPPLV